MRNTSQIIAARIILLIVVLIALGFGIFKLLSNDSPSKDQTSKSKDTSISKQKTPGEDKSNKPSTPPTSTAPSKTPSSTPATPNNGTSKSASGSPASNQPANGQNLTNSGPGSVVTLFAGTLIVGAFIHNRLTVARYRKAHE